MLRNLFGRKALDDILAVADDAHSGLKKSLGPVSVTMLGIGAIIGTGIYATIGTATAGDAVRPGAGPSLMLSFVITAFVCAFTALCYSEMAAMVPISGSAYTYSYATLGEIIAWIIGWDLIIEYGVGNVSVSITWSGYFRTLVHDLSGFSIPAWLATDFRTAALMKANDPTGYAQAFADAPLILGHPFIVNVPAFAISVLITALLVWGVRESARFNAVMVVIKIAVLLFFVLLGFYYVAPGQMREHWAPFQPNGWGGTLAGAAIVFFAYIGFDAVSTVAEETKNPGRDLPIGILASLAICTFFYAVIAAVFTGMIPYQEVVARPAERSESLTMALRYVAPEAHWPRIVIGFGSVVAQTAVLLVFMMGQPRIFFSMARDGLLPPVFAKLHPRFQTPHVTTILTGVVVALLSLVASIDEVVDLTNIGTLFAFVLVCVGIPILRLREPNRARPFRVPFGPFLLPVLGALSCLFLMYYLPPSSWWRFVGWLVLGLSIYSAYGYCHSVIGRATGRPERAPLPLKVAAIGFLLVAVGLFTIPHHAGPIELAERALALEGRTVAGLGMIVVGLILGIGGWRQTARIVPA